MDVLWFSRTSLGGVWRMKQNLYISFGGLPELLFPKSKDTDKNSKRRKVEGSFVLGNIITLKIANNQIS